MTRSLPDWLRAVTLSFPLYELLDQGQRQPVFVSVNETGTLV